MKSRSREFLRHVLPGVMRPIRVLWNEVIGFVFLALAVWSARSAINAVRDFNGSGDSIFRLLLTWSFTLIMIGFGVSSFLRARRISRSS